MSSDSEDDPDYVPTAPQNDDSGSSDSDSENERETKRIRTSPPEPTAADEEEARKKTEQDRVWQKFKSTAARQPQHASVTPKLVKVQKRYRFAGEDVLEVVEVPEDSEDAKKWPLWPGSGVPNQNTADIVNLASSSSAALVNSSTENSKSRARGPRKPKIVLPPLPASSQHKTKKLTTLDKSSMDWKAHVNSDGATTKDELEANHRSEGYLGKIEFLQRVSERKDSILEENQAKKRRR